MSEAEVKLRVNQSELVAGDGIVLCHTYENKQLTDLSILTKR